MLKHTAVGLLLFLAATFSHGTAPVGAAEKIIFAHLFEESVPHHQEVLWAAREIARRTDGRFVIEVFAKGALGSTDMEHLDAVKAGLADITYVSFSHVANVYGPISIGAGPYVFRDYRHWEAFRDSELFQELKAGYEDKAKVRVMGMVYYGQRHITSKRPITGLQDLKDMPIRSGSMQTIVKTLELLGTKPVQIPFHEVYQALKSGIVQAQENPLPTIFAMKFYEVAGIITLTGHFTDGQMVLFNEPRWDALPQSDRAIIAEVLQEMSKRVSDNTRKQEIELIETFRNMGVTVNTIDPTALMEAIRPELTGDAFPWGETIFNRLQAIR
ncbi:MAG: TRAP transporter substrate-binding protein DctP [Syntrophobacteraceae bacterium]